MILILNPGSTSLKYKLFALESDNLVYVQGNNISDIGKGKIKNHYVAYKCIFKEIKQHKKSIKYIGYRIVHAGNEIADGTEIGRKEMLKIRKYTPLAPQHNPSTIEIINYSKRTFKKAKHLGYFDTSYFKNLSLESTTYPIPQKISNKFNIRRYGFHGISHQLANESANPDRKGRLISIHLGAGCSLCAVLDGKPIETTMGFTPLEGLVMENRSGSIDPGIIFLLVKKFGFKKAQDIITNKSGLSSIMSCNGNMLDVLYLANKTIDNNNYSPSLKLIRNKINQKEANLFLSIYIRSIQKYIGMYSALLGGVDRVVFTGKIGYGSSYIRDEVIKDLSYLNVTKVYAVKPDEEKAIAQKIVSNRKK